MCVSVCVSKCVLTRSGPVGRRVSGPVKNVCLWEYVFVGVCVSECVFTRSGWSCGQESQWSCEKVCVCESVCE